MKITELLPGDIVRLKSGSPNLKVVSFSENVTVKWSDDDGRVRTVTWPIGMFERIA